MTETVAAVDAVIAIAETTELETEAGSGMAVVSIL
jgi:hypothetical protein